MTRRVTLTDRVEAMNSERYYKQGEQINDPHKNWESKSDLRQFLNRLQTVDHSHKSNAQLNTQLESSTIMQRQANLYGHQMRSELLEPYLKQPVMVTPKDYAKINQPLPNMDIDTNYGVNISSCSTAALSDMYTRAYGYPRTTPPKYRPSYFDEVSPKEKSSGIEPNSDLIQTDTPQKNLPSTGLPGLEHARLNYVPSYTASPLISQNNPQTTLNSNDLRLPYHSTSYDRTPAQIPVSTVHRLSNPNYLTGLPYQPPKYLPHPGIGVVDPWTHPSLIAPPTYDSNSWPTSNSVQQFVTSKLHNTLPPKRLAPLQIQQEIVSAPAHSDEAKRVTNDRYTPPLLPPVITDEDISSIYRNLDKDMNPINTKSMQRITRISETVGPEVSFDNKNSGALRIDDSRNELYLRPRSPPLRFETRLGKRSLLNEGEAYREMLPVREARRPSSIEPVREARRHSPMMEEYNNRLMEDQLRERRDPREIPFDQRISFSGGQRHLEDYDHRERLSSRVERSSLEEAAREREIYLADMNSRISLEQMRDDNVRDYKEYRNTRDDIYSQDNSLSTRIYRPEVTDSIRHESDFGVDLRSRDEYRDSMHSRVTPIDYRDERYLSQSGSLRARSPIRRREREYAMGDLRYENNDRISRHSGYSLSPVAKRSPLERVSDRGRLSEFSEYKNEGRIGRSLSREREVTRVQYQKERLRYSPIYRTKEDPTKSLGSPRYMKSELSRLDNSQDSSIISPLKVSSKYGDSTPPRKIISGRNGSEKVTYISQRHSRSPKRHKRSRSLNKDVDENSKTKDTYINLLLDERLPFQNLDERKIEYEVLKQSPVEPTSHRSVSLTNNSNSEKNNNTEITHLIGPHFPMANAIQGSENNSKSGKCVKCSLCKCVLIANRYEKHIVEKCTNRPSPNNCPYCDESYAGMRLKPLLHIEKCLQKSLTCPFCTVKLDSSNIAHLPDKHVDESSTPKYKSAIAVHKQIRMQNSLELNTKISSSRDSTDELIPPMKRVFKCPNCCLIGLIDTLREHFASNHLIYECIHCKGNFSDPDSYPDHLSSCLKGSSRVCSLCDKHNRHSNIQSLARHIMHFHKTLTCPVCGELNEIYRFKTHVHWCLFSNLHKVECPSCNIPIKLSEQVEHSLIFHPRSYCPFCQDPLTIKTAHDHVFNCLKAQPNYSHIEPRQLTRVLCLFCEVLMAPILLVTHMLQAHDTYSVKCPFCGDFYSSRREYSNHVGLCCQKKVDGNLPLKTDKQKELTSDQSLKDDVMIIDNTDKEI